MFVAMSSALGVWFPVGIAVSTITGSLLCRSVLKLRHGPPVEDGLSNAQVECETPERDLPNFVVDTVCSRDEQAIMTAVGIV